MPTADLRTLRDHLQTIHNQVLAPIYPLVRATHQLLVDRYDVEKYEPKIYKQALEDFEDLSIIELEPIWIVSEWKLGGRLSRRQCRTLEKAQIWFADNRPRAGALSWRELLCELLEEGLPYGLATFYTHLAHPTFVPIIDQHNFRAMRYLLRRCNLPVPKTDLPSTVEHLERLAAFIEVLQTELPEMSKPGYTERFLVMFGKLAPGGSAPPNDVRYRAV
jgi:hypothetical protein